VTAEPDRDLLKQTPKANLWREVGGDPTFRALVDAFYRRVEADPVLRPIFPADLERGKEGQFLFLAQYFGSPPRYSEVRGHPRLRMRHFPFAIDRAARDRWLGHMLEAIDEVGIAEPWRSEMRSYFEMASTHMINRE
jgi:hemoglobin